jgi:hypothetical protein
VFGSAYADNGGRRKQTPFLFGYRKEAEMRNLGWGLIAVFGGGILYLLGTWVFQVATGYYVQREATTALIITGMIAAIPLIVVAIGIRLVTTHPVVRHDGGHN